MGAEETLRRADGEDVARRDTRGGEMSAEETLRHHIRHLLSELGLDKKLSRKEMRQVEDDVLAMFADYSLAPAHKKDEVWAQGKERVLDRLQAQRAARSGNVRYNTRW